MEATENPPRMGMNSKPVSTSKANDTSNGKRVAGMFHTHLFNSMA